MAGKKPETVDEYIAAAPEAARSHLRELREVLSDVAPKARQTLKWGNPAWEEGRILFAFSAYTSHVNFMPTHASLAPFADDLKDFKTGKDTLQLPYGKPIPTALVRKIAEHRAKDVRENGARWMR